MKGASFIHYRGVFFCQIVAKLNLFSVCNARIGATCDYLLTGRRTGTGCPICPIFRNKLMESSTQTIFSTQTFVRFVRFVRFSVHLLFT
jgi:hypothetical protein